MPDQRTVGRALQGREDKRSPSRKNEFVRAEAPLFDSPDDAKRTSKPTKAAKGTQAGTKAAKGTPVTQGKRAASGRAGQAPAGSAKQAPAKTSRAASARRSTSASRTKKK